MANILYITFDGLQDNLGRSQILPYLQALSKKTSHCFFILSLEKKNPEPVFKLKLQEDNLKWFYFKYWRNFFSLDKVFQVGTIFVISIYLVQRYKIEIIHARGYPPAFIGVLCKYLLRTKLLFDMRGFYPEERVDGGIWRENGLTYKLVKRMERFFLTYSDKIIVLTNRAKYNLSNAGCYPKIDLNKITVIPTCTDLQVFRVQKCFFPKLKGKVNLIYVGSLGTWYLLDEMLEYFSFFLKYYPDAHLTFLTPSNPTIILDRLSSADLTQDRISIYNASREEVPLYLCQANFSLFFIKPVYSKLASCPTKLGESLASGVPVIVNYGVGDQDELIKENQVGIVIENFSDESYLKSISECDLFMKNKNRVSQSCRHVAENFFDLEKGCISYKKVYHSLLT